MCSITTAFFMKCEQNCVGLVPVMLIVIWSHHIYFFKLAMFCHYWTLLSSTGFWGSITFILGQMSYLAMLTKVKTSLVFALWFRFSPKFNRFFLGPHSFTRFNENRASSFSVIPLTDRNTDKQTNKPNWKQSPCFGCYAKCHDVCQLVFVKWILLQCPFNNCCIKPWNK